MAIQEARLRVLGASNDLPSVVEAYLLACQAEGMSRRTLPWYEQKLGAFIGYLRDRALSLDPEALTITEVRAFIAVIQGRNVSPFTIRGYVQAIKGLYTWLAEEGYIRDNPLGKLKLPRTPKYVVQPLTEEEVGKLLRIVNVRKRNGARNLAILLLLLDTGLRLSEAASLTLDGGVEAIRHGMLRIMGKGSRERFVPVGGVVQDALRRYIQLRRGDRPGFLFLGELGAPFTPEGIRQMVKRLSAKAGLEGVHPHRLRHTMAVTFLRGKGDAFALQRILGHSTMTMTRNYVQLMYDDLKEIHNRASPADRLYRGGRS